MAKEMSKETKESKKEKRERKDSRKKKSKSVDDGLDSTRVEVSESLVDKNKEEEMVEKSDENQEDDDEEEQEDTAETTPASKSKKSEFDEIEIDLKAGIPLSKKQQRLLKKGKLDVERLAKKNVIPKPILTEQEQAEEDEAKKSAKSEFGVWIGNLSFDTTREDIIRFIVGKSSHFSQDETSLRFIKVEESDISRVNIPKKENKIKGFAYVDLPSLRHVELVVHLSESQLNGRKLLIKNANSFEGRPEPSAKPLSKNPPSRILFVGNLSFDTTEDNLEEHFRHCGDIVRIRMATFEDSGKCKGFAFIDFKDEQGPTTALTSKLAKHFINRPLRMEYGEDRSKRNPRQRREEFIDDLNTESASERVERPVEPERLTVTSRDSRPPKKRTFVQHQEPNKRLKSSVALATAQRASVAIVPSSGKKITFD